MRTNNEQVERAIENADKCIDDAHSVYMCAEFENRHDAIETLIDTVRKLLAIVKNQQQRIGRLEEKLC